ncbi:hypothetical protein GCK72_012426 [Caenorhabditis remanei]|uniref:ELM2 domain-containing protein n=1 Tax=Caenorhabditis remanei TaxID=31234 RepID=A0A6A5GMU8_CAERE|nr:hypothetical protein GCK72_012426 [Caenorhabditis remanei]KAF1755973.1 hypothetical protein GCK72_012426 [Caenorhabditis remanei]
MQPNRPPAMPHFRQGLRRAVPMNTAPPRPGYDISILNAASARPNELVFQRFHAPTRPPGPPVCITLDSDGEEVEPVAKKARQSTDEVICLDSDTDQADSDSDDVIILDSDSDAGLESDSDDVVHVQTITYSRVGDKSHEDLQVGANSHEAVEPKQEPAENPETSHPTTPLALNSETAQSGLVLVAAVIEDEKNDVVEAMLIPKEVPEPEPMPQLVEHSESSHEDTQDEAQAMPVQQAAENPSEVLEVVLEQEPGTVEESESEDRPILPSSQSPETGAQQAEPTTLSTDGSKPADESEPALSETSSEHGRQDDELATPTPDVFARTDDEPDRDVLVEVHDLPNASAISELKPAEQSESENKENQGADSSDSTPQRILRSQISKISPSQPEAKESIYANKKIREGADYQTVMQPLLEDHEPPSVHYDKECEEKIWSPRIFDVEPPEMEDLFIEQTRVVYWKAIWRQFKGRILFEDALQHLMENDYDFAASLETIDRCLEKRPNLMKHPCMAQAARLVTHGLKETVSMRRLRKLALPNFQLPEVHDYSFKFLNLCLFSKFYESKCLCEEALCKPMDFEPRYGCSNCTKRPIEGNPLCLICQTYQLLTGEKRPARDVYFTDEEKELIEKWGQMEEQRLGRNLTREEFEKLLEKEKVKKWMKLEITEEEKLMLNFQHPKTAESYSRMSNKVKAKHFVKYLKPFVLPLFPACKCDQSKERQLMIEKEHLFVPEIPNEPEYLREEEFNPWVDG